MPEFHYYHPIEVRYGDLDPQGHVNNAKYLTYMEQARVSYIRHLGLREGQAFLDVGMVLADLQVTFHAPIFFGDAVRVGVRFTRLGNKSLDSECSIEGQDGGVFASSKAVMVTYDLRAGQTVTIPNAWREKIMEFEGLSEAL